MTQEPQEDAARRHDENAQLEAVIAGVTDEQWERLRQLCGDLTARPGSAGGWRSGGFHGSDWLNELVQLLYDAGLVTGVVNWVDRLDEIGEVSPTTVAAAQPTDLIVMITAMVRSDRFNEGSLAGFIENGALPAAVHRLSEIG